MNRPPFLWWHTLLQPLTASLIASHDSRVQAAPLARCPHPHSTCAYHFACVVRCWSQWKVRPLCHVQGTVPEDLRTAINHMLKHFRVAAIWGNKEIKKQSFSGKWAKCQNFRLKLVCLDITEAYSRKVYMRGGRPFRPNVTHMFFQLPSYAHL